MKFTQETNLLELNAMTIEYIEHYIEMRKQWEVEKMSKELFRSQPIPI